MNKIIKNFIAVLFILVMTKSLFSQNTNKKFNVIFILADDLGWSDLGLYGSDLHETPNLDRFASENLRFTNAYTAASISSPVRASLMTGKHPARLNMTTWHEDAGPPEPNTQHKLLPPKTKGNLSLEEFSIGEVFKQAGYFTAHVGKWHLGGTVYYPEAQGFDVNIGGTKWGMPYSYWFPFGGWREVDNEYRYVPDLVDMDSDNEGTYLTDRLTDKALKVIESKKEEPFYLQMNYYTPHVPLDGKPEYVEYYQDKAEPDLHHKNPDYAAMIASLDENVGRILHKVEEEGISDQTVIIFYSDNGGLAKPRTNAEQNHPLRSGKGSLYEGGVRVPLMIKWPGLTKPGSVCDVPVTSMDFYPTFLDLLGFKGEEEHNKNLDGISIAPVLKDPSNNLEREALYWHHPHYYPGRKGPVSAMRDGKWKLLHYFEDDKIELYNLKKDIEEQNNLADSHQKIANRLYQKLKKWRERVNAQLPSLNPDFIPEKWHIPEEL
ncbi:MAG: sulfatase [Bacteroidota bacterium]